MANLGFEGKNQAIFQMMRDFDEFLDMMTAKMSDKDTKEDIAKVFQLYDD